MGKVIPTLTNTTYITKILPQNYQNYLKTTSKLLDLLCPPSPFGGFEAKKKVFDNIPKGP